MLRNSPERYGAVAKWLHWLMAIAIIAMLIIGFFHGDLPGGGKAWMPFHKSLGITLLILAALRLGWRLTNPVPRLPADMPNAQKAGAHATHYLLYALMLTMPIIGWVMSSAADRPVVWWDIVSLPSLVGPDENTANIANLLHFWGGWAFVGLIALHFGGAMYHRLVRCDGVLQRMLPQLAEPPANP